MISAYSTGTSKRIKFSNIFTTAWRLRGRHCYICLQSSTVHIGEKTPNVEMVFIILGTERNVTCTTIPRRHVRGRRLQSFTIRTPFKLDLLYSFNVQAHARIPSRFWFFFWFGDYDLRPFGPKHSSTSRVWRWFSVQLQCEPILTLPIFKVTFEIQNIWQAVAYVCPRTYKIFY